MGSQAQLPSYLLKETFGFLRGLFGKIAQNISYILCISKKTYNVGRFIYKFLQFLSEPS